MSTLSIGSKAPNFSVQNSAGKTVSLSDFKGKIVILYFYPRDNTPGCTQQAQDFTTHHQKFVTENAIVLGISRDSVACHQKFKEKYHMPFELLSDPEEVVCQAYGVMKDKNMYGKKVRGIERSTFVIDGAGVIQKIWRKVKVSGHIEEVICFVKTMAK